MPYEITPRGTATGIGWEYQLERDGHFSNWVPYPASFTADPEDGLAIRADVIYWLYARNLTILDADVPAAAVRANSQTGQIESVDPKAELLKQTASLFNLVSRASASDLDASIRILLQSMGDATKAIFCQFVASCGLSTTPTQNTPAPTFDQFSHYELIPDDANTPADTFDLFAHFELIPDEVNVVTPVPYITQQVWRGAVAFIEGQTGTAWLANLWSDGRPETRYTDGGAFSLEIPYPNDVTFTTDSNKTLSITIPMDKLVNDVPGKILFTYPNGQVISQPITYVNVNSTLPNTIQYVQARFITNFFGSGASNDLLEIQMLDTYPGQPMFIAVQLASQAAPSPTDGGFQFNRIGGSGSARSFQLASGQNLKNKSFKIYIATDATQLASQHIYSFVTTSASSNGFVTL